MSGQIEGGPLTGPLGESFHNAGLRISALLNERGLAPQKRFGQHFLINPHARKLIFDALEAGAGDTVWEVGPGLGAQTEALLAAGASVRAFEIDRGFCALLNEQFSGAYPDTWHLAEGDATRVWEAERDAENAAPSAPGHRLFLGNLPYNIAGALIGGFIEKGFFFKRCVVTVQKEVALRMMAAPSTPAYSSLSVLCAAAYTPRRVTLLKPASFYPAPAVDSLCVRLDLKAGIPPAARTPDFFLFVRALFAKRRKTAANNLRAFLLSRPSPRPNAEALCAAAFKRQDIDPRRRAETLCLEDFVRLYTELRHSSGTP